MLSTHVRARRIVGAALVSLLAVAGLAIAAPASAAVVTVTISGTVTTADGAPAVGEWIQIDSPYGPAFATTDEAGYFSTVTYYDSEWPWLNYSVGGALGTVDPSLLDGSGEITLAIVLPAIITTTVQGTVTDPYGVPVAWAQLTAMTPSGFVQTTTDGNGSYSLTVDVIEGGELSIHIYGSASGFAYLTDFVAGGITPFDIVIGTGIVHTIQFEGVVLASDGTPAQGVSGAIGTDQNHYSFTTDENGEFSALIEYGEFGEVGLWVPESQTIIDVADLLGLATFSVVVQQLPPMNVTFNGHVTDVDGNSLPQHPVIVNVGDFGETRYAYTDDSGFYSIDVVLKAYEAYTIQTEGTDEPFWGSDPYDGAIITVDLISRGDGYELGIVTDALECDVNGDGYEDSVMGVFMLASRRTDWHIELRGESWGWRQASFGEGEMAETYCADLDGDGASELIARGETSKLHPKTGTTTVTHTWWVYGYATGTVTESTFGKGDLTVYFENLDDVPGVELIAVRAKDDAADKFWILDDPSSTVEVVKLGFHTEGTLAFEDVNGVPGVEIVTSITKANGNVKVEYYTRATGVGSIVKYTVK